jgi:fructose-1,6-bisphosphatase/inositol monophosphatase family enzyme
VVREPDAAAVASAIVETAAAVIRPRIGTIAADEIDHKSGVHDVVTAVDREAEALLAARLKALDPDAVFVGEESVAADPALLAAIGGERACWIVDPLDGTANFAAGLPLVAVMVAYSRGDEVRMAWIHDVWRGVTLSAVRGAGAFADGRRLRVAPPASLAHMAGVVSLRSGDRTRAQRIAHNMTRLGLAIGLRSAGLEYAAIAEGRIHFAHYNRLMA